AVVRAAAARRGESAWNPAVRGEPMSGLAALAVGVGAVEVGASGAIGLRVVRGKARARGRHPPAIATRRGRGGALQLVRTREALRLWIALVGFAAAAVAAPGIGEGRGGHDEGEGGGDQHSSHVVIVPERSDACRVIDIQPLCALSWPPNAEN